MGVFTNCTFFTKILLWVFTHFPFSKINLLLALVSWLVGGWVGWVVGIVGFLACDWFKFELGLVFGLAPNSSNLALISLANCWRGSGGFVGSYLFSSIFFGLTFFFGPKYLLDQNILRPKNVWYQKFFRTNFFGIQGLLK